MMVVSRATTLVMSFLCKQTKLYVLPDGLFIYQKRSYKNSAGVCLVKTHCPSNSHVGPNNRFARLDTHTIQTRVDMAIEAIAYLKMLPGFEGAHLLTSSHYVNTRANG